MKCFSIVGGAAQNGAHLVLDRAAVLRRAQAQLPFQLVVELPNSEAGHRIIIAHDCNAINAIN